MPMIVIPLTKSKTIPRNGMLIVGAGLVTTKMLYLALVVP